MEMQHWCKGKADIHPSLKYKEPRYSCRGLPDVVQMYMQTEADLKHVQGILNEMNRKPVVVCIN